MNDSALPISEEAKRAQEIARAMPTKQEMIDAFGPGCVEESPDGEVRYYYIRPWMSDEQKVANWDLFNEMCARARALACERSDRRDQAQQDAGVKEKHPNGTVIHMTGERMENRISRKKGFRPVTKRSGKRWVNRNGVLVPK
jgi:hypothetical protein